MLEILAPAGNAECAFAAIDNGANAIYLGLSAFSARQGAENFDEAGFRAVLQKARLCGVKVYVAMNTVVKDEELDDFFKNLLFVWNEGADAIILQDPFLGKVIHEKYPDVVLHLSTQAGVCNLYGARFAKECGFSRVILARETPLAEIERIAAYIETEVFVQGALCTCFSGQCYFSSFAGGNSGNRGRCKQPCRKRYILDRNGNTKKNYAISLSDLSVGEDIEKLVQAGVVSFKIEGRMRRAEYVAAAVKYYRSILDKQAGREKALSDLKRTYNRGNYTRGLAFGQDKRFLSTAVQGHIGEKVGVVKVQNGSYYVAGAFSPSQGDAFKILRDGQEVGGAYFVKKDKKGFIIDSKTRLRNGDGVFITTDTRVNSSLLQAQKKGSLSLSLSFREGELPALSCGSFSMQGETPLQTAQTRPLTEEELKTCFLKTDGLPADISFEQILLEGNIFLPKSELNALRRNFYKTLCERLIKGDNTQYSYSPISLQKPQGKNEKLAVIAEDFSGVKTDIAIYKPSDFSLPLPEAFVNGNFEKYLYFPAFATQKDLESISANIKLGTLDGIYAENYGGIAFAQEQCVKVFAGTGFNLFNRLSVGELLKIPALSYYTLSKECTYGEGKFLVGEKAFVLSSGNLKIMDLCYCPFEKDCARCDKRKIYGLTDENERRFPVRRYQSADGRCRFEVYNCADLIGTGIDGAGRLLDLSLQSNAAQAAMANDLEEKQKTLYENHTSGHSKRGVL
ncbi:MAG: U32 family peptidase [Clostridiales bacterium]|nr:U32 family peptidase [Clostridiales bacterium]